MLGQTINLCQQVTEFLLVQVAQNGVESFLGGAGQNRAAASRQRRLSPRNMAEERLNRRQAYIACTCGVAAIGFQVSEEIQHQWTREVLDCKSINRTSEPRS
jgi:hypothetical protein